MPITGSEIRFNFGIQESFNNITKDGNTIYFTTDTKRIYLGNDMYGGSIEMGNTLPVSHIAGQMFVLNSSGHYMLYFSNGTVWHSLSELDEQQFDELKTELQTTATTLQTSYQTSLNELSNRYSAELDSALEEVDAAIEAASIVTAPLYIANNKDNKTYNCNIVISAEGKPQFLYEETTGNNNGATDSFNFISDEQYNEKMTVKNNLLRALAEEDHGVLVPKTWEELQFLVRNGLHTKVLHIGDEFTCQKDGVNITWVVIAFDEDVPPDTQFKYSITLMMKEQWGTAVQFDTREALFYFPNGLEVDSENGSYFYFTIGAQPWYGADVGKSYMFKLEQSIPADGQLVINNVFNATCLNATLSTYRPMNNSLARTEWTTPIETVTMSLWDEENGNFLGTPNNSIQGNINSIQRALLGSSNYKKSAIAQWLNSAKESGAVWDPQTKFDRPPSWFSSLKGFMNGMDADFLAVVQPTTIKTARNTVTDGGGYDIATDMFYLLSKPQIYGGATVSGIDEGSAYEYYQHYSDLNSAGTGDDKNKIKTRNESAQWYWLRSPDAGNGVNVWTVGAAGQLGSSSAAHAYGVAAACTIY